MLSVENVSAQAVRIGKLWDFVNGSKFTFSSLVQSPQWEADVGVSDLGSTESGSSPQHGRAHSLVLMSWERYQLWGPTALGLLAPFWMTGNRSPNTLKVRVL